MPVGSQHNIRPDTGSEPAPVSGALLRNRQLSDSYDSYTSYVASIPMCAGSARYRNKPRSLALLQTAETHFVPSGRIELRSSRWIMIVPSRCGAVLAIVSACWVSAATGHDWETGTVKMRKQSA